jgi:hypothetical protein|tara:strand:- start:67 stop:444 length:378 start_codon:yes stop_codon:yes gene_type:complete
MTKDYKIGYGKPPKKTQFKKGQSGNPKGRPKGTKNLATDLEEEMYETIEVFEGGRPIKVTKQRAMLKRLIEKALKGDLKAISTLLQLTSDIEQAHAVKPDTLLEPDDVAILEAYTNKLAPKEERS